MGLNVWIPVISALSGAIVAGAISVALHWLGNQRAKDDLRLRLAEDRAHWAIEKRLERIQTFHSTIEKMLDLTIKFRIQQAWDATKKKEPNVEIPSWVTPYDKARGDWEEHFAVLTRELLLMDDEVRAKYKEADISWVRWLAHMAIDAGVQKLVEMEGDIRSFWEWLAGCYRAQFDKRLKGLDHTVA